MFSPFFARKPKGFAKSEKKKKKKMPKLFIGSALPRIPQLNVCTFMTNNVV